jgi:D-alanyl-D-alanine endopeptidase (penicillin-binding protein 7)
VKTGKILKTESADEVLPLASLTKLMTALVLLDQKINFNKKITIAKDDLTHVKAYINQGDVTSEINIKEGDIVTARDLWNAMLIASSNTSAVALARSVGLSQDDFVKKMNAKAKALGLKDTQFTEPSGIDPKNVGTAKEMGIIARQAFSNPTIRTAGIKTSYKIRTLNKKPKITNIYNRNNSLLAMKPIGMKTGYLTEAQNNVAVRFDDKVVVVLHAETNKERNDDIVKMKK